MAATTAGVPTKFAFFTIADNDKSLKILADIFGYIPWVLESGAQHTILHDMFKVFNSAMLLFAFLVLAYVIVKFAVSAASTGEIMEQGVSSIWGTVRAMFGVLMLIPVKSSYVIIQVFMMWIIVEGIGLADGIWNQIVDYAGPNTPIISTLNITPYSSQSLILASNILYGSICRQRVAYQTAKIADPSVTPSISKALPPPEAQANSALVRYIFAPGPASSSYDDAEQCGAANLDIPLGENATDALTAKANAIKSGLAVMIPLLNTTAAEYVFNNEDPSKITMPNPVLQAATHLDSELAAVSEAEGADKKNLDTFWTNAKNTGWIYAGAYYYTLAILNNKFGEFAQPSGIRFEPPPVSGGDSNYHRTSDVAFVEDLFNYAAYGALRTAQAKSAEEGSPTPTPLGPSVGNINWVTDWVTQQIMQLFVPLVKGSSTGDTGSSSTIAGGFFTPTPSGGIGNPLVQVQVFGKQMVNFLKLAWVMIIVASFALQLFLGFCSGLLPFTAVIPVMLNYVTIPALLLLGVLYISALTLANYVPLIPFIIFFFAVSSLITISGYLPGS